MNNKEIKNNKNIKDNNSNIKSTISGSLSGGIIFNNFKAFTRLIVAPFDVLKIRYQIGFLNQSLYKSIINIIKNEGIKYLWGYFILY